jgi:outer membrane protein OmpA-like peptidoglycan-associated protein
MKKIFVILLVLCGSAIYANAQTAPTKSDYSRWSIGINGGIPFYMGDFTSFSHNKTYYGLDGGLQITYQISSLLGLTLSGDYGENKAGSRKHSLDYFLSPSGETFYVENGMADQRMMTYSELYNKIRSISIGLGIDININRIFSPYIGNRRFTVLLTPTIWAQKFSTDTYLKDGDTKWSDGSMKQDWNVALGGALTLRYRASKSIDLQLKNSLAYVYNDKFDGIATYPETRQNFMWVPQLGIVWKIGNTKKSGKIDNLLYYGKTHEVPAPPVVVEKAEPVKEEPVVVEQPKEEPKAVVEEPKKVEIPAQPNLHFDFDKYTIRKDQTQTLDSIVEVAKQYPDLPIVIKGYADHVGTKAYNDKLSQKRAEAVKDYFVKQGIDENRISTEGLGQDATVPDKQARRVEVIIQN